VRRFQRPGNWFTAPSSGRINALGSDAEIAALAADVAAGPTSGDVDGQVDGALPESLLTNRPNPIQQRFPRYLRAYVQNTQ
jgi:hypothetical protein